MAFGQQTGPPASAKQVRELLTLLQSAGHADFRDARGPMRFTQRQAAGKFSRDEADTFIAQIQDQAGEDREGRDNREDRDNRQGHDNREDGGSSAAPSIATLLLSGTAASGKSTIASEIHAQLTTLEVPHATLDLDALACQWPATSTGNRDLMFENLAALWPNYQSRGATHLVLAQVVRDREELDRYRTAIPGAEICVCRLRTAEQTRVERIGRQMPPGAARDRQLRRTVDLEVILDRGAPGSLVVDNDDRPVPEVALDVLVGAGWISAAPAAKTTGLGR